MGATDGKRGPGAALVLAMGGEAHTLPLRGIVVEREAS
jgi:hypothetical protein